MASSSRKMLQPSMEDRAGFRYHGKVMKIKIAQNVSVGIVSTVRLGTCTRVNRDVVTSCHSA